MARPGAARPGRAWFGLARIGEARQGLGKYRRIFDADHARGDESQARIAGVLQARFQYRPGTDAEDTAEHIDHWIRGFGEWHSAGSKADFKTIGTGNVLVEDRGNRDDPDPRWRGWAYAKCDSYLIDLIGMGLILWADMLRLTAAMPRWKRDYPWPVYNENQSRIGVDYQSVSYIPRIEDFTRTCVVRVITYGEWTLGMPAREWDVPGWLDYLSGITFPRRRR